MLLLSLKPKLVLYCSFVCVLVGVQTSVVPHWLSEDFPYELVIDFLGHINKKNILVFVNQGHILWLCDITDIGKVMVINTVLVV